MKKGLRAAFAGLLCAIVLCGCASAPHDDDLAERGDWMPYDSYSLETWLRPVWHTREMYNETVLFVGEEDEAPLLYRPSEIRSVRSYGLNVEYTEGKDYILTEEGKIRRLRGSAIPYFETDEYYRKEPDSVPVAVFGKYAAGFQENRYIKYGEKDTFTSRQIAVTYAHDCVWEGSIPEDKSDRAGKFLKKLEEEKTDEVLAARLKTYVMEELAPGNMMIGLALLTGAVNFEHMAKAISRAAREELQHLDRAQIGRASCRERV